MTITAPRPLSPDHSGTRPLEQRSPGDVSEGLVETIARFAVEIVRGTRASATLSRFVNMDVLAGLERRADLTRRLRGRAVAGASTPPRVVLRGTRLCRIDASTVEASTVLHEPHRARFVAMRLERRGDRWKVTVLEIG